MSAASCACCAASAAAPSTALCRAASTAAATPLALSSLEQIRALGGGCRYQSAHRPSAELQHNLMRR
ncbi:hypothetical protein F751_2196 [Auxenochlorella protothecoides]|uniref:Uncharacterized protein n=1 Tax=Auxenochlorella protothecoides TaxID=3075 RepID=A0A087SLK5_AUXPR|nr:hypothetical protein F751_2196 [Auxenochlorella protothecoides]KFM26609.1 hypothetical protein F751_2196 [Auxenochlorella protothecoides]